MTYHERSACPLCAGTPSAEKKRIIEKDGQSYAIEICERCSFVYNSNCLPDTAVAAAQTPPPPRPRHYQIDYLLRTRLAQKPNPLVVEIGCGYGDVGLLVSQWGQFIGFEPSDTLCAVAASRGLDARREFFAAAALPRPADAIILDNVLEHVHDPGGVFATAAGALAKDGVLLVIVPNVYDIRRLDKTWRERHLWALPEHLNYFSTSTLKMLFERHGLTFNHFGLEVLRSKADVRFFPRAVCETFGVSLFGHNVFGVKREVR